MKTYTKNRISSIVYYLATILFAGGILLFVPFLIGVIGGESRSMGELLSGYVIPGISSMLVGAVLRRISNVQPLSLRDAMFVCTLAWVLMTLVGAVPFIAVLDVDYLDACFETMSGFTTTGITVLSGLDEMPRSILFWRALTQWIGGLGILSMFILLGFKGGAAANKLFMAEGHKIASHKPFPSMFHTARILWTLYLIFTLAEAALLSILGLDLFDAVTHALTTISTGGYSIYDQSIAHFQAAGYAHFHLIELVILLFMIFGGINFFIHYRLWRGSLRSLWDNTEMRLFWVVILGGITLIFIDIARRSGLDYADASGNVISGLPGMMLHLKDIGFQVVSLMTTTGYGTRDIGSPYFPAFAKQFFLVLMVIGGCAGSTGGGFKVIRVAILMRLVRNRIRKMNVHRSARLPLNLDGQVVEEEELKRIITLFFLWILLILAGGGITALFSDLSGWQCFSGMFSALGNIGPCYFSVQEMAALHPVVKLTYILGMLAGRLEIIPVFIIFSRKFFK